MTLSAKPLKSFLFLFLFFKEDPGDEVSEVGSVLSHKEMLMSLSMHWQCKTLKKKMELNKNLSLWSLRGVLTRLDYRGVHHLIKTRPGWNLRRKGPFRFGSETPTDKCPWHLTLQMSCFRDPLLRCSVSQELDDGGVERVNTEPIFFKKTVKIRE